MDSTLKRYVMEYFRHLMTDQESKACLYLELTMKFNGEPDEFVQKKAEGIKLLLRYASSAPEALRLAADGYEIFVEKAVQRIVAEQSDQILFNCCPKCGALARTPTARQCRVCKHDWHNL